MAKQQAFEVVVRLEVTDSGWPSSRAEAEALHLVRELLVVANAALEKGGGGLAGDGITMIAWSSKQVQA
jgi:hypothetical protein